MIITIDGPAGTGKSTVAKRVAHALGFVYFDTGAMYRALTAVLMKQGISPNDESDIQKVLEDFDFRIVPSVQGLRYLVGDQDLSEIIRSPEVTKLVSAVAAVPAVRRALVDIQRRFAVGNDSVFEGRDLGSVVFPHADLKVYLTALAAERADRRHKELLNRLGEEAPSLQEVLDDLNRRDYEDSTRAHSPLVVPHGAVQIDTSNLTIDEVVSALLDLWQNRSQNH
jgi:cytidylate kinase